MDPLVVHTHIPKTGGTSLRQLVRQNYRRDQLVNLDRDPSGGATQWSASRSWDEVARRHRELYESLDPERRAQIRCVEGHSAPFLIPAVTDRPVRALCMLRDPVDLVASHYRFSEWKADRGEPEWPGVAMVEDMRARGWTLKDAYERLGGGAEVPLELVVLYLPLFNSQARHVLLGTTRLREIPFDVDDAAAGWRERALEELSRRYVVGTQDRFSQSVRLFADAFGWRRVYVPRVNVGPSRSGSGIDAETRALIRAHNRIDAELHAHFSARLAELPATSRLRDARGRAGMRARRRARRARHRIRVALGGGIGG